MPGRNKIYFRFNRCVGLLYLVLLLWSGGADAFGPINPYKFCLQPLTKVRQLHNIFALGNTSITVEDLWCYDEISKYKNPSDPTDGYLCLANITRNVGENITSYNMRLQNDVVTRDQAAQALWRQLGTENGYKKNAGVNRGTPLAQLQAQENYPYGTGWSPLDDVPMVWCGVEMKALICHIAFPQGFGSASAANIRAVCQNDCQNVFRHCNRRQPSSGEYSTGYISPEINWTFAKYYAMGIGNQIPDTSPITSGLTFDNNFYCAIWNYGWGYIPPFQVAAADDGTTAMCVPFNAASSFGVPTLLVIIALLMNVMVMVIHF